MEAPKYLTVGAGLDAVIYGDDAEGLPVYRRLAGDELIILATDHDRIVAAAETRGWNKAVEAAIKAVDRVYPVSDPWGHHTLPHIDRRQARAAIAALRKPEVEG